MADSLKTQAAKKRFLQAYVDYLGNIAIACKAARIHRDTYYKWKKNDPEFAEQCWEALEDFKDWGESQLKLLMKGIPKLNNKGEIIGWWLKPSFKAMIYFLRTHAKDRGYGSGPGRPIHKSAEYQIIVKPNDDDCKTIYD